MSTSKDPVAEDRQSFVEKRIVTSLKVKEIDVKKLFENAESEPRRILTEFFENPESRKMFVSTGGSAPLTVTIAPPAVIKKKTVYFLKKKAVKLTPENIASDVIFGDLATSPLETLYTLSQEVFLPLLSNPENQMGLPDIVAKDLNDNMHRFLANVYVTMGQMKGKTLLPLPPTGASEVAAPSPDRITPQDKDRIHALESAVVTWTRQIKDVLKASPEDLFKGGKNPGPVAEVDFWENKSSNLNLIHEQLSTDSIRKVIQILEITRSTYYPPFSRLIREVEEARTEANDIILYLRPMKIYLEALDPNGAEQLDFPDMPKVLRDIMHLVFLVWKNSKFYNTPVRLGVLIRLTCNDVIEQSKHQINAMSEEIFQIDNLETFMDNLPTTVAKLKSIVQGCAFFKDCYFEYKAKVATEIPTNPWRIQNSALFSRLDLFLERCHDILDLLDTSAQFLKLDKVEIGGTKGRILTTTVKSIHGEFITALKKIQTSHMDLLDINNKHFDELLYEFQGSVKELEKRLSNVLSQGFDDCSTVFSAFKLVESFEGLLEREAIHTDLEKKQIDLIKTYGEDLKEVQEMFQARRDKPPVYSNTPPTAGALIWVSGLLERINEPMEKFQQNNKAALESDESKDIVKLYDSLKNALREYQRVKFGEWSKECGNVSSAKLKQPLLRKDTSSPLLFVNFDPALVRLLREVKYIEKLNSGKSEESSTLAIPQEALEIYGMAETYRKWTGNLDLIVNMYNHILTSMADVEKPLLQQKLEEIDQQLEKGLTHLNWKSSNIDQFITEAMETVKDASTTLSTLKNNVREIQNILAEWESHPLLFERKENKTFGAEEFLQKYEDYKNQRETAMRTTGEEIHRRLAESLKSLKGISKTTPAWRTYVEFVNGIVVTGINRSINNSMKQLADQLDPSVLAKTDSTPMIEVKLELVAGLPSDNGVVTDTAQFSPALDGPGGANPTIKDIVENMVKDFYRVSCVMRRLDTGEGDYMKEAQSNSDITKVVERINAQVKTNGDEARKFKEQFLAFSYLWTKNPRLAFKDFLGAKEPSFEEFDKQIANYEVIQSQIQGLADHSYAGWLKVDAKPMRSALSTTCGKWKASFTDYLKEKVTSSMSSLSQFLIRVNQGLAKEVQADDMPTLKEVMGHIRDVRVRNQEIEGMFKPLKDVLALLEKHHVKLPDDIHKKLDDAPAQWANTQKMVFQKREELSPLQDQEAKKIKVEMAKFNEEVVAFRENFLKNAPFVWGIDVVDAYHLLDENQALLCEIEITADNLNNLQELFDLTVSAYKDLKECRLDVKLLKSLWDMISLVLSQFNDWMKTPFKKVAVDDLVEDTKKFAKEIKGFNTKMRNWVAFQGLEAAVKNMLTALPLVSDLRSPSMRDRHWRQLLKECGKTGSVDPEADDFTLQQLLDLGLHKYVEEVGSIVDKANKELIIENNLRKVENNWVSMSLNFGYREDLKCPILGTVDDVVESLEDNMQQLQNMQNNRFVEYFINDVNKWFTTLVTVDSVISLWKDVQKGWANLFPIFILSADIKQQLPEDAKRFAGVDQSFREFMDQAKTVPNVIEACSSDTIRKKLGTQQGIQDMLQDMLTGLEKCEKSLADYLETKRVAFPRFYFVAPADLVDILSKGSSPQLVMKHMSKLVDSVDTLVFPSAESDTAIAMISKDGKEKENVKFHEPFVCQGPVETWLGGVLQTIRNTLAALLADAHEKYPEMPRDQWIMNYPCQIANVASRVMWTTEVNTAFERLEDGQEGALKEYNKKQIEQLTELTTRVQNPNMPPSDRRKAITMITVDVHARDVVAKLIEDRVESSQVFGWQSQLRYSWDEKKGCIINIADAEFHFGYEYIGNCGCLVITPLTDRCYITLTQALRLVMGGAPAGPAGTGKTETTKDLARAMGIACYVFNCSDQMDYRTLGNIFKGLAMSGSWGCFDEFNRIPVAVLSVVATQFKSILDAIRNKKSEFMFQGEKISLIPTTGSFITMNPGYKGRTELPENLKALFRPCAMVVPDFGNICEIMLASEGFIDAKGLSKKFVTLYSLNRELLSKQDHYDWGLRAIKSVLVIAGSLKRADPDLHEGMVLMRALRDTNMAKLSRDDVEIFKGLIGDLFPKMDLPPKRDPILEEKVKEATRDLRLQYGENEIFVLKVVQFKELLDVRHSVFVLGPAASGKTCVWKTLASAFGKLGSRTTCETLNPKAVTSDELYGYINQATREWKDGLLSKIMRDLAEASKVEAAKLEAEARKAAEAAAGKGLAPKQVIVNSLPNKWIILDGDIDAEWIESMNTVMDDNKVLTLASNERIPLTPAMRMVFEISHLKNATPATVSRAGILFINETDVGWAPFKDSWIDRREDEREKQTLERLFDTYVASAIQYVKKNCVTLIPISDYNMVQTLCFLLEGLLTKDKCPPGSPNEVYEHYFVFACIWAFAGALAVDATTDYRVQFSNWWRKEFAAAKFPDQGLIYDYYVEPESKRFAAWTDFVKPYVPNPDVPFGNIVVNTVDTVRLTYVMNLLTDNKHPVLMVGTAGTGKTTVVKQKLRSLPEDIMSSTINFNSNTDSRTLQLIMDQPLEKKGGRSYGPPGRKKLIYFIDDLNMPKPDKYNTQSAIALLRQHMDYGFWYDRAKMFAKEVKDVQYISAMNPKAGSFTVDDRLQRHYGIFACHFPNTEDCRTIYGQILNGHLQNAGFDYAVSKMGEKIVNATIELHKMVAKFFLPTAVKFHYQFNLRELSNVVQGLLLSKPQFFPTPLSMARLWLHECHRVFGDRLITDTDSEKFTEFTVEISKKCFDDVNQQEMHASPLLFCSFTTPTNTDERFYNSVPEYDLLRKTLDAKLREYNDNYAVMNLEMFEQAMQHVCRITRIIDNPRGNALLVGVGGSGKQSLARLSSFICGYETFQITVTSNYGMNEFRNDLMELYKKTGIKNNKYMFLFTDGQIVDEKMLMYINDLLSSGYIPDLFGPDDKESIMGSMVNEVKQMGGDYNSKTFLWDYFIDKVRSNLHAVLCFSPVGEQFRVRCRQFPGLINCTVIDWFKPWPEEALVSVASRFLQDVELGGDEVRASIAQHMAFVHSSVNDASTLFLQSERRYNYTTPKSFLELISIYKLLLARKRTELDELIDRLAVGLDKLRESAEKVRDLQEVLKEEQVVVEEKKVATEALLVQVGQDRNIVESQTAIAQEEEKKTGVILEEVAKFEASCQDDLAKAEPIVKSALEALKTLDKGSLTELKSFTKPADDVMKVVEAVMVLTATGPIPKDRSWAAGKKMMGQVDAFLKALNDFDKENIPDPNIVEVKKYFNESFDPVEVRSKSFAAAGLCSWVINIVKYNEVYKEVEPKRILLQQARDKLAAAKAGLDKARQTVNDLQARLNALLEAFEQAQQEKIKIEEQARKTQEKLELAARLVNGLADENVRWAQSIQSLKTRGETLIGDVLLAAAFLSYAGAFTRSFRENLLNDKWYTDLMARKIPTTPNIDPIYGLLTDDAQVAAWNNEGLPSDRVSVENGTITTTCQRWPLFIDPQLQGVKWIKNKESKNGLKVVQLTQDKYLDIIERAIQEGQPVLIENLGETIDAVLEPVLARSIIKKGRNEFIMLGDKPVEYDRRFKLYLQTKMSNPHYRPEIAAQTTIINFMVTESGLEDQLLATVFNKEKPELEAQRVSLLRDMNQFKIDIKQCEDNLLYELSNAKGDILENRKLIENLEETKLKAKQIQQSVMEAIETGKRISETRDTYRPAAVRGSLLFFQIDQLSTIDPMYQYSLESFSVVFDKALNKAVAAAEVSERVENIIDSVTETLFTFVSRGLFERHKLIFSTMLCFKILQKKGELDASHLNFLLRGPKRPVNEVPESVAEWCSKASWSAVQALTAIEGTTPSFASLPAEMEGSWRRWKEWCELEKPEDEKLPLEWKNLTSFQRLLVIRCLRPDRITMAMAKFVAEQIGRKYIDAVPFDLQASYADSGPTTPIFFILSPGVDPVKSVEQLGKKLGFTEEAGKFINVSLGQGQEEVAERALEHAFKSGGWVMLNNIHLTAKWLISLEKTLDQYAECFKTGKANAKGATGNTDFRVFLSADPSPLIPMGILQRSIKLTNEPPQGLLANLTRGFRIFSEETWEASSKQAEFKAILFSLCFFHAVILERKKFGAIGWNRNYPFNLGDLATCVAVCSNYLEDRPKVPWEDLRYIFGEIMYGGHITDDIDRRLCSSYFKKYIREEVVDGIELFPGFISPASMSYVEYLKYIEENLPAESPTAYGLHPNAEINFRTTQGENLFQTILELQPRASGTGTGQTMQEVVKQRLDDILAQLPEQYNLNDILERMEARDPVPVVFYQECERMNILLAEMKRSLFELDLGLKGDLTISDKMQALMNALFDDKVPESWSVAAYASLRPLGSWMVNLMARNKQLGDWATDPNQNVKAVWLSGFFNPQSFLTAVMQVAARKSNGLWALDKMALVTEVTKRNPEEIESAPREGAYIYGLFIEGAKWDTNALCLDDSKLKDLYPKMPVILIKAVPVDKADFRDSYQCPVYKTQERGQTFVFMANLRTKQPAAKWVLAGVALLLDVVE